eukprot:2778239-Amphidinium_carterae.1
MVISLASDHLLEELTWRYPSSMLAGVLMARCFTFYVANYSVLSSTLTLVCSVLLITTGGCLRAYDLISDATFAGLEWHLVYSLPSILFVSTTVAAVSVLSVLPLRTEFDGPGSSDKQVVVML